VRWCDRLLRVFAALRMTHSGRSYGDTFANYKYQLILTNHQSQITNLLIPRWRRCLGRRVGDAQDDVLLGVGERWRRVSWSCRRARLPNSTRRSPWRWEMCSAIPDDCAGFLKRLFVEAIAVGIFQARTGGGGGMPSMSPISPKKSPVFRSATLRRPFIFRLDEDLAAAAGD